MKTKTTKTSGLKVTAGVKAGGLGWNNHNRTGIKIKAGIKAGSMIAVKNHNRRVLSVA